MRYRSPVFGTFAGRRRKERPMQLSIDIEFRIWKWRLSIHLSRH
jgi:hypothetical protein